MSKAPVKRVMREFYKIRLETPNGDQAIKGLTCKSDDLQMPLLFPYLLTLYSGKGFLFSSMYLLFYFFLSVWAHGFLFYSMGYVIIMNYFDALIVPDLTNSSLFKLVSASFDMSPSFYEDFLIFLQDKVFCWIKGNKET